MNSRWDITFFWHFHAICSENSQGNFILVHHGWFGKAHILYLDCSSAVCTIVCQQNMSTIPMKHTSRKLSLHCRMKALVLLTSKLIPSAKVELMWAHAVDKFTTWAWTLILLNNSFDFFNYTMHGEGPISPEPPFRSLQYLYRIPAARRGLNEYHNSSMFRDNIGTLVRKPGTNAWSGSIHIFPKEKCRIDKPIILHLHCHKIERLFAVLVNNVN